MVDAIVEFAVEEYALTPIGSAPRSGIKLAMAGKALPGFDWVPSADEARIGWLWGGRLFTDKKVVGVPAL
jgi:hypothetical protein